MMPDEGRCVVRLTTSAWCDSRGIHLKKSLTFLRRKCSGHNVVEEDASNIGAEDVVRRIVNLDECCDGVYEVVVCNERRDWEMGYVDDWDYELKRLEEE